MAATMRIPVITSEVPLLAGDVLRQVYTPVVSPPSDPMSVPSMGRVMNPESTATITGALATRRLSAGAVIAEQIGIDLNAIGKAEARKIMSVEHKVLGFRPPQGSLAAEAQAAAAKHPEVPGVSHPDPEKLKEAAKIDAERILAERTKSESGTDSSGSKSPSNGAETAVDLNTITEAEARKLMSHEHRALGFRPPPGSLAAEAQAAAAKHADGLNGTNAKASNAKARRNSNEPSRKPRQNSMGANTGVRQRRGSSETRTKPRRESHGANGPANGGAKQTFRRGSNDMNGAGKQGARRGSNESQKSWRSSTEMKRTSSDQSTSTATPKAAVNGNAARRASAHVAPSTATKEELLREAALRDAERIKMTRGINGTSVTEHAHVDIKDLAEDDRKGESITLPGPAQANVDHDAKAQPSARDAATGKQGEVGIKEAMPGAAIKNEPPVTQGEVAPGELEHESGRAPVMPRTETTDSVQIICNILG